MHLCTDEQKQRTHIVVHPGTDALPLEVCPAHCRTVALRHAVLLCNLPHPLGKADLVAAALRFAAVAWTRKFHCVEELLPVLPRVADVFLVDALVLLILLVGEGMNITTTVVERIEEELELVLGGKRILSDAVDVVRCEWDECKQSV